jgi:hypothetical protein
MIATYNIKFARNPKAFILVVLILLSISGYSQHKLNLDFEVLYPDSSAFKHENLKLWLFHTDKGHIISIDTTTAYHGKSSLLLERNTTTGFSTVYTIKFPVDSAKGRILTLRAFVKKQSSLASVVQPYITVVGQEHTSLGQALKTDTVWTDNQWKELEVKCPVNNNAIRIALGVRAFSPGKTWFDHMQILLDGVPYQDVSIDLTQEASPSPARTMVADAYYSPASYFSPSSFNRFS